MGHILKGKSIIEEALRKTRRDSAVYKIYRNDRAVAYSRKWQK
jgi:hypothetical protein